MVINEFEPHPFNWTKLIWSRINVEVYRSHSQTIFWKYYDISKVAIFVYAKVFSYHSTNDLPLLVQYVNHRFQTHTNTVI